MSVGEILRIFFAVIILMTTIVSSFKKQMYEA